MRTRLTYVYRRIAARDEAQAVVRLPGEKFDIVPASSNRLRAMLTDRAAVRNVLGVFSPDVSFVDFMAAMQ